MININQLVYETMISNTTNIKLEKFNKSYWDSLPQDKNNVLFDISKCKYHTLILNNQIVGIAGLCYNKYFQIYIDKKFRGQNIYGKAADLIYKKYKLDNMYATIASQNFQGFKAAIKSKRFKEISQEDYKQRYELGILRPKQKQLKYIS